MTTVEITDLPRYIAWADGLLPPAGQLERTLLSGFRDDLRKQPSWQDDLYLRTLETTARIKYHGALGIAPGCDGADIQSDIYVIAPSHSPPPFPSQLTPIHEELRHLENRIDDYRLFCMVLSEYEPNELRDAFYGSLNELKFEIRSDSTYKDLPKFREFLHELSREIVVVPYFAPSIRVENDLKSIAVTVESTTVV